jgi:23S rRNA pseudouridine2605 synthase
MAQQEGERIAKFLARAGVASRRAVERMIGARRIAVNGLVVETPATFVSSAQRITVDGKAVAAKEPARLWRYYKPRGLVTTARDPQGRPTVFEHLPESLPRVVTVGRLDLDSEGLLLLTNDGALARELELPSSGWERRYRVRVRGCPGTQALARLRRGVTVAGMRYGPIEAAVERKRPGNAWLLVTLREGKNREIRRVFDHLGHPVSRLIRVGFGPFELGTLEPGTVAEVANAGAALRRLDDSERAG